MRIDLTNFVRPAATVKLGHAISLFVLLQIYFVSNTLSFGFWKSGAGVFTYMLAFYGTWLAGIVLLLSLILAAGRRFGLPWLVLAALVVLTIPFSWELWVRSLEIDSSTIRRALRILLLPVIFLYFRIGFERAGWTGCAVLLLCVLSLAGHAGLSFSNEPSRGFNTFELDKKTNVHVIMLDSLTHSPFSKEFMGLENQAADHLATLDDTIYAGSLGFAEKFPTRASWGTLFNLGHPVQGRAHYGFFSGSTPSRLTTLLRGNGYNISTGFSSDYFGWRKGKHVDHYFRGNFQRLKRDLSCATKKGKLGFCTPFSQSLFSELYVEKSGDKYEATNEWPNMVVDLIDRAERNANGPLFSAFHIYLPGHTPKDYRSGNAEMFAEYKRYFTEGVQRAREVIDDIDRLRKRYPESVFIVSGDHGPFLSRETPEEEDRRFVVLDRHGVALALLNASNLCSWSRDWLARQRYLTPSRMLAASLACNGESRRLTEHFTDNEEFIRFGESFATGGNQKGQAESATGEGASGR